MDDIFSEIYSPEVLRHVRRPQNMGKMVRPTTTALVGNPVCGDIMKFYLKIAKKGGVAYIKDIKFQTLGCGAAIATSSIMTSLVKGKALTEAKKVGKRAVISALGGLPATKIHCSSLAEEGLQKAIANYEQKE